MRGSELAASLSGAERFVKRRWSGLHTRGVEEISRNVSWERRHSAGVFLGFGELALFASALVGTRRRDAGAPSVRHCLSLSVRFEFGQAAPEVIAHTRPLDRWR